MKFGINTIDDLPPLRGKTVLCRVDINEPMDKNTGELLDTTRLEACAPTILELALAGAKVVLLAHQGSDIEYQNFYGLRAHSAELSRILGRTVGFMEDVCGPSAGAAIAALAEGEILLLDNVRFVSTEQTLFELNLKLTHEQQAKTLLVEKLAPLADYYVNDAFAAAHRNQPSLCGFQQLLPSAMGRLFEREYCEISGLMEKPGRPCVYILGGAKITDAFSMMDTVLSMGSADEVLTGGLVAPILMAAKGMNIGAATLLAIEKAGYTGLLGKAAALAEKHGGRIVLPKDFAYVKDGTRRECTADGEMPEDAPLADIGSVTAEEYESKILSAGMVFANGPVGIFEQPQTEWGTKKVWEALGATKAHTVIGGGDSIRAAKKYKQQGNISYICTGGGALIRFLSGEDLPVVRALRNGRR